MFAGVLGFLLLESPPARREPVAPFSAGVAPGGDLSSSSKYADSITRVCRGRSRRGASVYRLNWVRWQWPIFRARPSSRSPASARAWPSLPVRRIRLGASRSGRDLTARSSQRPGASWGVGCLGGGAARIGPFPGCPSSRAALRSPTSSRRLEFASGRRLCMCVHMYG